LKSVPVLSELPVCPDKEQISNLSLALPGSNVLFKLFLLA